MSTTGVKRLKGSVSRLALAAVLTLGANAAQAQTQSPVNVAQASRSYDFSIPAKPLLNALADFTAATNVQIVRPSAEALSGLSPAVVGRLTADQALRQLLAGSGLDFRFTNANTATLTRLDAAMLPTVTVESRLENPTSVIGNLPEEYAGGQVARGGQLGILGNRDMMDTPFSQTSYTARLMQDQQARSIADVAVNDSSVHTPHPQTGHAEQFIIRGFNVGNHEIAFGGLYGIAPAFSVSTGMAERIEILKGPAALLSGMSPSGGVGGMVNVIPKRATSEPITQLTTNYISESQLGGRADVGRRFGVNDEFGIRINGFYQDGDTPVDDQARQEGGGIVGLDYRGEMFRLSGDFAYQERRMDSPTLPSYLSAAASVPTAPDNTNNWFQPWSWTETEDTFSAVRGEIDLSPSWTAFGSVGGRIGYYRTLIGYPSNLDSQGNFTSTPVQYDYKYTTDTQEGGVRGEVVTGPVKHGITVSATRYHETVDSAFRSLAGSTYASNIYNPTNVAAPNIGTLNRAKSSDNELTSLAFGDVLSVLDDRLQLIAGLRQQQVLARNYNTTTGAMTARYKEDALTPAVGIVVKPWNDVSLYANYIEGLQRGAIVGATYANAGQILPPYISKQKEIGAKADWGSITTTVSLFEIEQPSGSAPTPTGIFSADDQKRNRGVEINAFGEIVDGVRLLSGVTFMDGKLTKTATGVNQGNDAPAVPEMRLVLGGEWDAPFARGVTFMGRMIYSSSQYVNNANTQSIPDWTRFDLGARYSFETADVPLTLRFNIENVFDRSYWQGTDGFGISSAAPRTFLLSLTADF